MFKLFVNCNFCLLFANIAGTKKQKFILLSQSYFIFTEIIESLAEVSAIFEDTKKIRLIFSPYISSFVSRV